MNIQGWANFAWSSDYGQIYLIDCDDYDAFQAPTEREIVTKPCHALQRGLVVYTKDCLQQQVRLRIYDSEPAAVAAVEPMGGRAWTQCETVAVSFPSCRFTLSSPSYPTTLPGGPIFHVDTAAMMARITWMEFDGVRDDSVPIEPDVIEITLWPA